MRKNQSPILFRVIILIACGQIGTGCALIYHGHEINDEQIASIRVGVTTEQELLSRLGMPDAVIQKQTEGVRVFQYKDFTSFGVGIPFLISLGRARQRGQMMNVMIKEGKVVEVEHNFFAERFFSRSVENDSPALTVRLQAASTGGGGLSIFEKQMTLKKKADETMRLVEKAYREGKDISKAKALMEQVSANADGGRIEKALELIDQVPKALPGEPASKKSP